jgi:hypothetical protein
MEKYSVKAHLPAEQPTSPQKAWLPFAYAYPRWPRHPFCAPQQGSRKASSLIFLCCLVSTGSTKAPNFDRSYVEAGALPYPKPLFV